MRQPWRCLWRGSLQMTRTTRLRRTILHLLQIFFTEAITFMVILQKNRDPRTSPRGRPGARIAAALSVRRCRTSSTTLLETQFGPA